MFFIPLNQIESVQLVIHALRAAGGEADCTTCPARRVCMKQCLSIADAVTRMVDAGTLPNLGDDPPPPGPPAGGGEEKRPGPKGEKKDFLKVIK
jgi:hypothetical protein